MEHIVVCCKLRTGIIITGVTEIVVCIGGIVLTFIVLQESPREYYYHERDNVIKCLIGYFIFNIIINAFLIFGAIKHFKCALLLWIICAGIINTTVTGYFSHYSIASFAKPYKLIVCVVLWIKWFFILSCYQKLYPCMQHSTISQDEEQCMNMTDNVNCRPQQQIFSKKDGNTSI